MKLRAKKTYPQLDGIIKAGDIVTLELQRYEQQHLIHNALYGGVKHETHRGKVHKTVVLIPSARVNPDNLPKGVWKFCDELIAPKGSVKACPHSYVIITEDGRRYGEDVIINSIGYKSIGEIFERV